MGDPPLRQVDSRATLICYHIRGDGVYCGMYVYLASAQRPVIEVFASREGGYPLMSPTIPLKPRSSILRPQTCRFPRSFDPRFVAPCRTVNFQESRMMAMGSNLDWLTPQSAHHGPHTAVRGASRPPFAKPSDSLSWSFCASSGCIHRSIYACVAERPRE